MKWIAHFHRTYSLRTYSTRTITSKYSIFFCFVSVDVFVHFLPKSFELLLCSFRSSLILWNLILSGIYLFLFYRLYFHSVGFHTLCSISLRKISYFSIECDVGSGFSYMSLIMLRQAHFMQAISIFFLKKAIFFFADLFVLPY